MSARMFHIGDVLSMTTGYLVSERGVKALYDLARHMTGQDVWTHQLPRVSRELRPALIAQHPWLAWKTGEGINSDNWRAWLDSQMRLKPHRPEWLEIEPLKSSDVHSVDSLAELVGMVGPERVIAVVTP